MSGCTEPVAFVAEEDGIPSVTKGSLITLSWIALNRERSIWGEDANEFK